MFIDFAGNGSTAPERSVLDLRAEGRFDRVSRLARRLFGVPMAVVTLTDATGHQPGTVNGDDPRAATGIPFPAHVSEGVSVIEDIEDDDRFGPGDIAFPAEGLRFAAGTPIVAAGARRGTLCIYDREPHTFGPADAQMLQDLAELIAQELEVHQLAWVDELTGLANRRAFHAAADHVLRLSDRTQIPAVAVYADLNGLKSINDAHGHAAGDRALLVAASAIADAFRDSDIVARIGGDEFCVLMTGTTDPRPAIARIRASLRNTVGRVRLPHDLAVSVGFARYDPGSGESVAELVARADADMYRKKHLRDSRSGT